MIIEQVKLNYNMQREKTSVYEVQTKYYRYLWSKE